VDSSPSNGLESAEPYVKRWGDSSDVRFGDVHYYNYQDDCQDHVRGAGGGAGGLGGPVGGPGGRGAGGGGGPGGTPPLLLRSRCAVWPEAGRTPFPGGEGKGGRGPAGAASR
jgi:hypothetical protein